MSELKTCFKRVDYDLGGLLHYIDIGDIGLPNIQRPFLWSNTKVRDLFDSMYRGFPVGYLLFWENAEGKGARQIGTEVKQHQAPSRLIVDGQQRLTALYAVFRGRTVLDANYHARQIEIAFHPRDGRFEVADAAIRRDPEWIPNISACWVSGKSSRRLVNDFIAQLPRFKGVWYAVTNFVPLPRSDTSQGQYPRPHKRSDDGPASHAPGGCTAHRRRTARASRAQTK